MKLTSTAVSTTYYFESDKGGEYRTDESGSCWERRYGDCWEPVCNYQEETDCISEFMRFRATLITPQTEYVQ